MSELNLIIFDTSYSGNLSMRFINPLVILRILSTILFIETVSYLLCLPVAHIYNESPFPFLCASLIAISVSVTLFVISHDTPLIKINIREGFLSVSISWLLFSAFGALPYIFSNTIPSFVDAFFESASGFTTTGASIVENVEVLPYSILFWRSLTHWIGGLGIILLVIIILPSLRITAQQLFSRESSLQEKIHPKTQAVGYRLLFIYFGLTITEIILLILGDMNLFDSICHTFGTVATGGFSTKKESLVNYSSYTQYIVALFMLLSGVSFIIYYYIVKLKFKKVLNNEELWFYLTVVLISGAISTGILLAGSSKSFESSFREGFFQVISIITTTGFSTADYIYWPHAGVLLIFLLLFSGASTGSTTGSIKMARHLLVIKNIKTIFVKLIHPNAITQIKLNEKPVNDRANISVISFVLVYIFIFLIGTIIIVLTGNDPVTSASSVATMLGNIGPGLGTVGPMSNYAHMPAFSKVVFSLLMIIGRLEINTFFIILGRLFWKF